MIRLLMYKHLRRLKFDRYNGFHVLLYVTLMAKIHVDVIITCGLFIIYKAGLCGANLKRQ